MHAGTWHTWLSLSSYVVVFLAYRCVLGRKAGSDAHAIRHLAIAKTCALTCLPCPRPLVFILDISGGEYLPCDACTTAFHSCLAPAYLRVSFAWWNMTRMGAAAGRATARRAGTAASGTHSALRHNIPQNAHAGVWAFIARLLVRNRYRRLPSRMPWAFGGRDAATLCHLPSIFACRSDPTFCRTPASTRLRRAGQAS